MRVSIETVEGLKMIQERYWFGMFTGSQDMDLTEESAEFRMRDALNDAIRVLESAIPALFEPEELEGGSRGGTRPNGIPDRVPFDRPAVAVIDITEE